MCGFSDHTALKISAPIISFREVVFATQALACRKTRLGISRHGVIFLSERSHLLDEKFQSGDSGSIYLPR